MYINDCEPSFKNNILLITVCNNVLSFCKLVLKVSIKIVDFIIKQTLLCTALCAALKFLKSKK